MDHLSHPPLHPYLQIWIQCRRYGDGMTGQPCFPSAGSYLDQDAELMLAFEVAESIRVEIEKGREARELVKKRLKELRGG